MSCLFMFQDFLVFVGQEFVVLDWVEVIQECINFFVDVMGDYQFIYVDFEKVVQGFFGIIVVYGFMSFLMFVGDFLNGGGMFEIIGVKVMFNYGFNWVCFFILVCVGSCLCSYVILQSVE